jgi:uncharacterized membrane protein
MMTGAPLIAGWIAHIAFWVLIVAGVTFEELSRNAAATFGVIWLAGMFGLPYLPYGEFFFSPLIAILDIVLVFIVFKGDVRLR